MWEWKDIVNLILQAALAILLPFLVWLIKTVMGHNNKIALLEQQMNDSVSTRLSKLENKMDSFDSKLETVHVNIAKNNVILDHLNGQITYLIRKMEKEDE